MAFNPSYVQYVNSFFNGTKKGVKPTFVIARVTHVVTGPFFENTQFPDPNYQDPTDLGVITFQVINGPQDRTLASRSEEHTSELQSH